MKKIALLSWASGAAFVALASTGWTLQGCSSSSSSSSGSNGIAKATLAENAYAVDTEPMALDATSVTMPVNAETNSLKVGDTIASSSNNKSTQYAFFRKIAAIKPSNGTITFETENAELSDLFGTADIEQKIPITQGDPNAAISDTTATTGPDSLSLSPFLAPSSGSTHILGFGDTSTAFALANGKQGFLALPEASGSLDFDESYFRLSGGLEFDYVKTSFFNPLPEHFRLALSGGIAVNIGAQLTTTTKVTYKTPSLVYFGSQKTPSSFGADLNGFYITTIFVDAGPVFIPIDLLLRLTGNGQIDVGGSTQMHGDVNAGLQIEAGFDYTSEGGTQPVDNITKTFNVSPLTGQTKASVTVTVYPINVELSFNIWKVPGIGPYIQLKPYVSVTGTETETTGGADGGAPAANDAGAGGGLVAPPTAVAWSRLLTRHSTSRASMGSRVCLVVRSEFWEKRSQISASPFSISRNHCRSAKTAISSAHRSRSMAGQRMRVAPAGRHWSAARTEYAFSV